MGDAGKVSAPNVLGVAEAASGERALQAGNRSAGRELRVRRRTGASGSQLAGVGRGDRSGFFRKCVTQVPHRACGDRPPRLRSGVRSSLAFSRSVFRRRGQCRGLERLWRLCGLLSGGSSRAPARGRFPPLRHPPSGAGGRVRRHDARSRLRWGVPRHHRQCDHGLSSRHTSATRGDSRTHALALCADLRPGDCAQYAAVVGSRKFEDFRSGRRLYLMVCAVKAAT